MRTFSFSRERAEPIERYNSMAASSKGSDSGMTAIMVQVAELELVAPQNE